MTTQTPASNSDARKRNAERAREVEAATEDVDRVRAALNTCAVLHDFGAQATWSETPQYVSCECGEVFEAESAGHAYVDWHAHVIDEQVKAVLTALGGVPGRSEAVIKAAAWDEGFTRGFYDVLAGGDRDASESSAENPYRTDTEGQD